MNTKSYSLFRGCPWVWLQTHVQLIFDSVEEGGTIFSFTHHDTAWWRTLILPFTLTSWMLAVCLLMKKRMPAMEKILWHSYCGTCENTKCGSTCENTDCGTCGMIIKNTCIFQIIFQISPLQVAWASVCVYMCVCVCVRACVCAHVHGLFWLCFGSLLYNGPCPPNWRNST